jgi:hypothetical protein
MINSPPRRECSGHKPCCFGLAALPGTVRSWLLLAWAFVDPIPLEYCTITVMLSMAVC